MLICRFLWTHNNIWRATDSSVLATGYNFNFNCNFNNHENSKKEQLCRYVCVTSEIVNFERILDAFILSASYNTIRIAKITNHDIHTTIQQIEYYLLYGCHFL